ncbi:MAG: Hpt domain-containing protein [Rhodospirillales bacterium]|nr:Hpt domain-containing protein [Rhodospirillales bacterium]
MSADDHEIIKPPSTLKGKVSYGPDGVNPDVLDKAEALIAGMQGDYLEWVQDDLKKAQEFFDRAVADAAGRMGHLKEVYHVAHDIKGQGGSFGYPLMTAIANQLCRYLEHLEEAATADLDLVKVHIDALRLVIGSRMQGDGGTAGANIMRGLEAVIAKRAARTS